MITGTSGRISLTFGSISSPVIPGMLMSDRIRISDWPIEDPMRDSASGAELAKSMMKRCERRSRRNCWRNNASTSGSSSTTSTKTLTTNLWSCLKDCWLFLVSWQNDRELGKFALEGIDVNRATVLFHNDVVTHRQSKPGAFAGRLGGKERIEHFFFHIRRNSGAVVADPDLDMICASFCRRAHDRLAIGAP